MCLIRGESEKATPTLYCSIASSKARMAMLGRLQKLRSLMKSTRYVNEPLSAYIVPTDDQHQVSINDSNDCIA